MNMKKILGLLGAVGLITSASSSVVSCFGLSDLNDLIDKDAPTKDINYFVTDSIEVSKSIIEDEDMQKYFPDGVKNTDLLQVIISGSMIYSLAYEVESRNKDGIKEAISAAMFDFKYTALDSEEKPIDESIDIQLDPQSTLTKGQYETKNDEVISKVLITDAEDATKTKTLEIN
ncbi:hypothetical protein Zmor_019150 [Zophobas morio]|uniref:Lipoprotein n=1 Tax=Zophobas morio TaxID=2755281 RepID=A0AA38M134_9CUCU|nr:hypothetical protein Zmor_019150 [Zophobas morio]